MAAAAPAPVLDDKSLTQAAVRGPAEAGGAPPAEADEDESDDEGPVEGAGKKKKKRKPKKKKKVGCAMGRGGVGVMGREGGERWRV